MNTHSLSPMTILEPPSGSGKTREEIARAYKSEPWWYDIRGFFILTLAYNDTLGRQLRFFSPNMGPQHLELACGTGTLLAMFLKWRKRRHLPASVVVGLDYAEAMLQGARHRFRSHYDMRFEHADAAAMPFPNDLFDTINIANAVHSLPNATAAMQEARRVLKPGGQLAANVLLYPRSRGWLRSWAQRINDWGMRKGILYTPYEPDQVRQMMLEAGFDIRHEAIHGNCMYVLCSKR